MIVMDKIQFLFNMLVEKEKPSTWEGNPINYNLDKGSLRFCR